MSLRSLRPYVSRYHVIAAQKLCDFECASHYFFFVVALQMCESQMSGCLAVMGPTGVIHKGVSTCRSAPRGRRSKTY